MMNQFTRTMRKQIKASGMSMSELARQCQTSRSYLYRILDQTHCPSLEIAERIAKVLGFRLTVEVAENG